jgi:hypothetical protein
MFHVKSEPKTKHQRKSMPGSGTGYLAGSGVGTVRETRGVIWQSCFTDRNNHGVSSAEKHQRRSPRRDQYHNVCMYIYIYAHINVSKAINPPYGLMVGIPAPKMGIADFPPCGRRLTTPQQGAPPRYALGGWGRKGMM